MSNRATLRTHSTAVTTSTVMGRFSQMRSNCARRSTGGAMWSMTFCFPRSSSTGSSVIIGARQTSRPPPAMMPISWMPLKFVMPIAKNAAAVVAAPVKMPCPVLTIASVIASRSVLPSRSSSSNRATRCAPKSIASPTSIGANVMVRMFRCPTASVV